MIIEERSRPDKMKERKTYCNTRRLYLILMGRY